MLENSQEVASKKNDSEKELFKTETIGVARDIMVKIAIKYETAALPDHLNPSYKISSIHINEEYIEEMLGRISVLKISKQFYRDSRIRQSQWKESTRRFRQTLDKFCSWCNVRYCHKYTLLQTPFLRREGSV